MEGGFVGRFIHAVCESSLLLIYEFCVGDDVGLFTE